MWFSAGLTYQKMASEKQKRVETYAIQPPLNTSLDAEAGKDFKKMWYKLHKERVLYSPDENINSR